MISTDRLCMGCMTDNGGEKICPICGFDSSEKNPKNAVSIKTLVNERFVVGRATGCDGEGIDYIGWDVANDAIVKIREYFPEGVAKRNPDKTVAMVKGKEYPFNEGLLEFLEINKAIKSSELPSLVPVIDVFEENGSAFVVMQNIPGVTLTEFLSRNGGTLKWEQARALFLPLIDTISGMHELGFIHKGISTDNILVGRDGKLRLMGYSINKFHYENGDIQYNLVDGFAAVEQYKTEEEMQIGPYTDVYGIGATLFSVLIGNTPKKATDRLEDNSMSIPSKFAEELPRQVLSSLANALQVMPKDRTADMEAFKNQLVYGEIPLAAKPEPVKKEKSGSGLVVLLTTIITAILILIVAIILAFTVLRDFIFGGNTAQAQNNSNGSSSPIVSNNGSVIPEDYEDYYIVPDFTGEYYSDIVERESNEYFVIKIIDKEFSTEPRGTVIRQSVVVGSRVKKGTEIEVVISLGKQEFKMPNLINMTKQEAELALLKAGFLYDNINSDNLIYDEDFELGVVVKQEPAAGEKVHADMAVEIFINSDQSSSID